MGKKWWFNHQQMGKKWWFNHQQMGKKWWLNRQQMGIFMEKWDAFAVICLDVLTRCDPISSQICGDSRLAPYPTCGPLSPGECFQSQETPNPAFGPKRCHNIWGFPRMGIPQNGWFRMENHMITHDLGVITPILRKHHMRNQSLLGT